MASQFVDRDEEHLKILSIFQYAAAGVTAVLGSFPLLHVMIGLAFAFMPTSVRGTGPDAPPREIGFVLMGLGGAFVLAGWSIAAAHFLMARFLRRRTHYLFCVVASAITSFICMFSSGVVGIASLVILLRPGMRALFGSTTGGRGGAEMP